LPADCAASELAAAEMEGGALPDHLWDTREALRGELLAGLAAAGVSVDDVRFNGPADDALRLPNTLSVGVRGLNASALLASLGSEIAASAGAACHTHSGGAASISAVLRAMAVPPEFAVGTLRLSTGRHTTLAEARAAGRRLAAAIAAQLAARK
jgi:cysteine desulfurase